MLRNMIKARNTVLTTGAVDVPPILEQLNIDPKHWSYLSHHFESEFKSLVGTAYHVKAACEQFGQLWAHGIRACRTAFQLNDSPFNLNTF